MRRFALVLVATVALCGTASAQQAAPPGPNDPSLHAYPDTDKTCLEWTDSCRTCLRVADTGVCPNIGIACQPKPITCVRREEPPRPETAPKPEGAPK
jgi:hypothetical protein